MYVIDETNSKQHSYPTYGRQFLTYRWFKPIFVAILFFVFYLGFNIAMIVAIAVAQGVTNYTDLVQIQDLLSIGYDDMDMADTLKNIVSLGSVVLMIPALWVARIIVRDRPFTSYSSSRGGWSSKVFWKVFPIALLINGGVIIVTELIIHGNYKNFDLRFTIASFVVLTILGPLQCIAEEYTFRGLMMQTFGSWFRVPVIAVMLQAVVFMLSHPYNMNGKIAVLISGLTYGASAWIARGIEASSALHIANNMTIFYLQGLNLTTIQSEVDMEAVISDVIVAVLYLTVLYIMSKKSNLFHTVRKDDLAKANEKTQAKIDRKAAKRAARDGGATTSEDVVVTEEKPKYEGGKHYKN